MKYFFLFILFKEKGNRNLTYSGRFIFLILNFD